MTEAQQVSNWNLPNALTTLRIVLVPFFGWALLVDGGESVLWRMVAFVIFVAAMITDKIDGDIARSRGLITNFGKIADPIADKAITGMAFIGLSIVGDIWWWVTIVVLAREWSVTLLRLSILKSVVMQAADLGKLKTTVQGVALGILLLPLPHGDEAHGGEFDQFGTVGEVVFYIGQGFLAVAVALTLWSGWSSSGTSGSSGRTSDENPADFRTFSRIPGLGCCESHPPERFAFVPLSSLPRRGYRTLAAGMGVALGATSLAVLAAAPAQAAPVQIQILATNDFHGRLINESPARPPAPPCSPARSSSCAPRTRTPRSSRPVT